MQVHLKKWKQVHCSSAFMFHIAPVDTKTWFLTLFLCTIISLNYVWNYAYMLEESAPSFFFVSSLLAGLGNNNFLNFRNTVDSR